MTIMKKYIYFLLAVFCVTMVSCGDDNNTNDEPIQPDNTEDNKFPTELVGVWCYYSGSPNSLFVEFNEEDILNMTYTFTSNGNLNETFVYYSPDYEGKKTSTIGNWSVENKKLSIYDWNGNKFNGDVSYKINDDNSMTLTINGNSAIYYKQEDIVKYYSKLILGGWNNNWPANGKIRYTFSSDGTAERQSNYINGFFYGSSSFTWSISGNELITQNEGVSEQGISTINYLNKRSLSWGTLYLIKE